MREMMSVEIIKQKLLDYECKTIHDERNALKEIAQEIALLSLSRAGFFRVAAFQGGTSLRILYGLDRFSEDLDFILEKPDKNFNWESYVQNMREEFKAYGYSLEVINKTKLDKAIKTTFLKANSEGGILTIKDFQSNRSPLKIKLEIDTHTPEGSNYELKYLDFPLAFSIRSQDLSSLFASKSHALLCRKYTKGRDWYDFSWYVSRKATINFKLLNNAINQAGPWANEKISMNSELFLKELRNKISNIDWDMAKKDVQRFLRPRELPALDVWSKEFFLSRADKLESYLD